MQRQQLLTGPSKSSDGETPPLDEALKKPSDDELFYTASVHFLKKRLQEKSFINPKETTTQSCCNLTRNPEITYSKYKVRKEQSEFRLQPVKPKAPALPMHQVLPFPKSNKDSLFTRIKNTFRKYRQRLEMNDASCDEEIKSISNFKFPRCERLDKCSRRSDLIHISEEDSNSENATDTSVKFSDNQ